MRPLNLVFLGLLTPLVLVSCRSAHLTPTQPVFLGTEPDSLTTKAYQRLALTDPADSHYEDLRVDYLLERLGKSSYALVRNDERYRSQRAVMHLRWKHYNNRGRFHTAEEYIDQVAWGSFESGKDYLVQIAENEYYPLRWVLHNELDLLDQKLTLDRAAKKRLEEQSADKKAVFYPSLKNEAIQVDNQV